MQSTDVKETDSRSSLRSLTGKHVYLDLSSTYKSLERVKECLQSIGAVSV